MATTHSLWAEGRSIQLVSSSMLDTAPSGPQSGSLVLAWNPPSTPTAYDGAVVVISDSPLTAQNQPVDGTRYRASTNFSAPADTIGGAVVVSAFYGYFGDSISTATVTVTNLDPNKIYYAAIHAASNILQYYTPGSKSYAVQTDDGVNKNSAYLGSIPRSTVPPASPTNGQVYYDPNANMILQWSETQATWISVDLETVPIGDSPTVDIGTVYFNLGTNQLKFFDGTSWTVSTNANCRARMGEAWVPFAGISQVGDYPKTPVNGQFVCAVYQAQQSAPPTFYIRFYSLGQWYNISPGTVQVFVNGTWTPIAVPTYWNNFGSIDPVIPAIGDMFFNTASKKLLSWTGSGWVQADTADAGIPSYDKVGVGVAEVNHAVNELIDDVKVQLGYPSLCIELDDSAWEVAVKNALARFRQLSDSAYQLKYVSYTFNGGPNGGQNKYYLNDPRDGTNRIVGVLKIHRINMLGISSLSAETGLYAQAFFNQLYQGSNVDVVSIHLMGQLSELYEKVFAGNIMFTFDEKTRELTIFRRLLQAQERVVLEVQMEKTDEELINDRYSRMWIQDWAKAEAMYMLGLIRNKYGTLPSATGQMTLNGDLLITEAKDAMTDLRRQINDFEVGNMVEWGNTSLLWG